MCPFPEQRHGDPMQSLCSCLGGSELPQPPRRNLHEPAQPAPNKKRSPQGTASPPSPLHGLYSPQPPSCSLGRCFCSHPKLSQPASAAKAGEPAPPTSVLMAIYSLPITGPVSRGHRQHYVTARFPTELTQSPPTISKRLELQGKKYGVFFVCF